MKKRIISMCLAMALICAMLPQIAMHTYATQADNVAYEMREELIEFKLSDGTLYYTNTISYPYFLGNTAAEIKINNKYSAIIEECRSNTTDFDALYQEVLQWSPDGVNGLPFYDDISAEVTYCNNGVISIKECSTMWSGGMHPYSDYVGYTYRISDGSELSLTDILSGSEHEVKSLIERYNQGAASYYKAEVVMASPFMLTSAGLCFLCNVGDAVPRAEIVIPFTEADAFSIFEESKPEVSTTTDGTGYIGAVQKAIDEMQAVGWGSGYGALYDVDGNGIEELIMVYSVSMETDDGYGFPAKACSLYTMANGKAIQLIDKEILYVEAGGPSGYAAVVEHDSNIYFAITSETGETGGGPGYSINRYGTWKLYSINGESIDVNTTVEYDYFRGEDIEYEKSSALFNGKSRSYREYEEWRDSLVEVLVVDGYYYDEKPESVMTLDELLAYLKENPVEDTSVSVDDSTFEDYARTEWIEKHIEYANSSQYKTQVVQGFSGALDDALEDIKDNGMITAYNTLDSINTILDFDLDLTDVEEYELLLAQILFSRTGVASIDEIYDEYLSNNIITICEILVKNIPEMTSSKINEKVEKLKELLNTIKGLSRGDTQYNEVLSQIMDSVSSFDDLNFGKEFIEAFDKEGLSFAADFLVSEIDTAENTLSEVIIYMAAGEAYCNTSDAFGDMILALRKHIAIPSDNPIFEPYQSDKMLVNDQMIWTKLGLKNAGNSIGPDPLNTPIYLSALAKAIENYYTQLEAAKAGNASVIAQNAMAEFATETADNLIDAELNVVVSLFECLPVVKQFSAIKALFDGTQFVIDTFTGIDDRAYLGTMVMRLYGIAYIHYLSVDNLATNTDAWGTITTFSPIEQKFDANAQFADAAQFDEAVTVYRAILSVATDYAEEYYTTYYEAADSILSKYPNYKPTIPPYVDTDSDTFKSVKQKIIELQMQKNDLAYEWCHSSKIIFNHLHGVNTYDNSEMLIFSFKCPVSVTFKNESGEVIATLSNGNSTVAAGYEQYFFTSEVISGSGEYVKIAAVPKSYDVVIEGTGTGRMDASVSEYTDGQLGETKQYFGIPVSKDSSGYFGGKEDSEDIYLILDGVTYDEGDYSNTKLKDGNKMTLYIVFVAIVVGCVGLVVMILKRKKSNN